MPRSAVIIANSIRLKRQIIKDSFLVVEGVDDKNLFQRFTDSSSCRVVVAYGRDEVVELITILRNSNFKGVLGIIDLDYSRIIGEHLPNRDVLTTDSHDLETMLLNSPSLSHVLIEYGSEEMIKGFLNSSYCDIRDALLSIGAPIGCIRLISAVEDLSFDFDGLDFYKFVNVKKLSLNKEMLIDRVENHSGVGALDKDNLLMKMKTIANMGHDLWHLCCGHDLVEILSIGLCRVLGKNNKSDVKPEKLETSLRLGYELAYFADTTLFQLICRWQEENAPYVVLKYHLSQHPGKEKQSR